MNLMRVPFVAVAVVWAFACLNTGCGQHEKSAPGAADDTLAWYKKQMERAAEDRDELLQVHLCGKIGDYFNAHNEYDSARLYYLKSADLANSFDLSHEEVTGLGMASQFSSSDESKILLDSAFSISKAAQNPEDIAYILQELGFYHYDRQEYRDALHCFREEARYDRLINDSAALASCLSNMANSYSRAGFYDSSIVYYKKAIAIAEAVRKDTNAARYSYNLGLVLKERGSYNTAMEYLLNAARFFDQDSLKREQATCYHTLGSIHLQLGNLNKALEFNIQSYNLRREIGYDRGIAMSLTNIGEVYLRKMEYDTALKYLQRSLELEEELDDKDLFASSFQLMGEAHYCRNNFPVSEEYYQLAIAASREANDPQENAAILNKLSRLYIAWNKPDSAIRKLEEGRMLLADVHAKDILLDNYGLSLHVYRSTGNLDAALDFSERYARLQDTLLTEQNSTALAEKQTIYDLEKKDNEIDVLNEREKTQAAIVDRQVTFIWTLIGGSVLLSGFLLLAAYALRTRKTALKQNKTIISQQQTIIDQKQTLIEQKQAMMGELHHRVKNNLQILSTMLDLQQRNIADPQAKELIRAVEQRMHAMVLVHTKLYGNDARAQVELHVYLQQLLSDLTASFGYAFPAKGIVLTAAPVKVPADIALSMGFICTELVTNAFKYAAVKGREFELSVTLRAEKENLVLAVADNGPGLPPDIDISSSPTFGLQLVRMFAHDLDTEVSVESTTAGTTFRLHIPYKKQGP